jgi:hypothetical protein
MRHDSPGLASAWTGPFACQLRVIHGTRVAVALHQARTRFALR